MLKSRAEARSAVNETNTIRVSHDNDGFWAEVVELPGCFASGTDVNELREALQDAIGVYLSDPPSAGEPGRYVRVRIDEFAVSAPNADGGAIELRIVVSV
jgi:predicted RNase H-like HicB family nuclease